MLTTWPMIYTENNHSYKPIIGDWADRMESGKTTIEALAAQHYVPQESVAHALSCYYFDMGEPLRALDMVNAILDVKADWRLHIQRIRILMTMPKDDKKALYADCALWGKLHVPQEEKATEDAAFADWDLEPGKRLHLGFVCTYFSSLPCYNSLRPLLSRLNREKFKVTLFSVGAVAPKWLTLLADDSMDILTVDPGPIVNTIAEKKVDILFDMNGFLRLDFPAEVFIRRPSPVQVIWFNTLTSSGIRSMHYFLSAGDLLKPEDYSYFSEKICLLPSRATATFDADNFPLTLPPHVRKGYFTFGSFTSLFKINDEVLEAWAQILQKSPPSSRIFIKAQHVTTPRFMKRAQHIFRRHGIDLSRVMVEDVTPIRDMMLKFSHLDICLNTFSYGACSTTATAMWQGIPTLTMDGEMLQSRVSADHMHKAGLSEFVARDLQDFIEKGAWYAHHPESLVDLRRTLRERLRRHVNFNPDLFTPEFEDACRWMWKDWLCDYHGKQQAA